MDPVAARGASAQPARATYQDVLDAPAHRVAEITFSLADLWP